jgi:hypothetical protein
MPRLDGASYSLLPNKTLGRLVHANMSAAEPVQLTSEEVSFAEKLRQTMLGKLPPMSTGGEVEKYEVGKQSFFSTDSGDVSTALMALRIICGISALPSQTAKLLL